MIRHIHKNVRHLGKRAKEKKGLVFSSFFVVTVLAVPFGLFFYTKGTIPYTSELAITEHSILGKSAGSVIPASGESTPTPTPTPEPPAPTPTPTPEPPAPTPNTYPNSYPDYPSYPNSYPNSYPDYPYYPDYPSYPSYPTYSGPATIGSFNVTPRSVERGGLVNLSWSIYQPNTSCRIIAEVQRPSVCNTACQTAVANASSSINSTLSSGTTNANDQYGGNRAMTTALRQGLNSPYGYARGTKSIALEYSTTFTLSCGSSTTPFRSIIYVTDRVEG